MITKETKFGENSFIIDHYFEVVGAGTLMITESCNSRCGGAIGFSVGVNWSGSKNHIGGVMDKSEAKALAGLIYKVLASGH